MGLLSARWSTTIWSKQLTLLSTHMYSKVLGMFSATLPFCQCVRKCPFPPTIFAYTALRRKFLSRLTARENVYSHWNVQNLMHFIMFIFEWAAQLMEAWTHCTTALDLTTDIKYTCVSGDPVLFNTRTCMCTHSTGLDIPPLGCFIILMTFQLEAKFKNLSTNVYFKYQLTYFNK